MGLKAKIVIVEIEVPGAVGFLFKQSLDRWNRDFIVF